ncbi:MAG TPA: hypothetical protein VED40_01105 [Azospirillaceae bacterium]|nr:hypothetical protein [Azospirillaceae bacterium]
MPPDAADRNASGHAAGRLAAMSGRVCLTARVFQAGRLRGVGDVPSDGASG